MMLIEVFCLWIESTWPVIAIVALLLWGRAVGRKRGRRAEENGEEASPPRTVTCPSCGAKARVAGGGWECGYCGDCGRMD